MVPWPKKPGPPEPKKMRLDLPKPAAEIEQAASVKTELAEVQKTAA